MKNIFSLTILAIFLACSFGAYAGRYTTISPGGQVQTGKSDAVPNGLHRTDTFQLDGTGWILDTTQVIGKGYFCFTYYEDGSQYAYQQGRTDDEDGSTVTIGKTTVNRKGKKILQNNPDGTVYHAENMEDGEFIGYAEKAGKVVEPFLMFEKKFLKKYIWTLVPLAIGANGNPNPID